MGARLAQADRTRPHHRSTRPRPSPRPRAGPTRHHRPNHHRPSGHRLHHRPQPRSDPRTRHPRLERRRTAHRGACTHEHRLLHAGDLPDRLATDLTAAGVRIAPRIEEIAAAGDTGRIERRHVLAVCYALVQRIDEEPVLAVRLRTPSETSPSTVKSSPAGLLALTDIDPKTFYLVPTVRDRRNAASR